MALRSLGRGLLERQGQARNDQEATRLMETYTLTAFRLGEIIKVEKELAESGKTNQWVEELLAMMDRFEIEAGREPISDRMREAALGGEARLEAASRRLVEEIASMGCAQERVPAGDRGGRDVGTHPVGGDPQQRLRTTGENVADGEEPAPTVWRRI